MRRFLFLSLFATFMAPWVYAQREENEIACQAGRDDNKPHKKKLWDGYEISLGPARNAAETEDECTAAIYNKAGKVVFRTNGFSVVLDEDATGEDFDGDGKPDVVFRTDTGGGMHCCWEYIVYSLSPQPHKLFELAKNGKVDMEKDKEGRMTIWHRTGGLMILTSSMANRSYAEKVLQVRDGKITDVTAEFCGLNDDRFERYEPTPDALKKLTNAAQPSRYDADVERIIGALESRTLQHVYCQQFDEALKDFSLWPIEKRKIEIRGFADALAKDYPEFAAKLRDMLKTN